ncbi:MAG: EscU/YscU/HrcU family type III secretion system export apparatus switch protein [Phyllobacteriaceae bacterium]|nr:EscU/YscU/HrcU family type III secretion system export apparatus switch protein [Phyllobacteriaceae bacterium]
MADNDTEERDQPPTARRLQRLREQEGRTAHSTDFVAAFTLLVLMAGLAVAASGIGTQLLALFGGFRDAAGANPQVSVGAYIQHQISLALWIILPILLAAMLVYVMLSVIDTRGLVISAKNLAPDFARLNPVDGLKRIFGLHGVSQFIKIVVKTVVMSAVLYVVFVYFGNAAFWTASCAPSCTVETVVRALAVIIAAALLVFVIAGLLDLWVSRALFRHDNRMSHSDIKREQKEEMGSREMRSERQRVRREIIFGGQSGEAPNRASRAGPTAPPTDNSLQPNDAPPLRQGDKQFVVLSQTHAVTLSYSPDKRGTPIVVSIDPASSYRPGSVPSVTAPALADDIAAKVAPGNTVRRDHFATVSMILVRLGLNKP